eukprot:SAG22_NODE_664_length_8022_cov_2.639576_10_plen_24_part_01
MGRLLVHSLKRAPETVMPSDRRSG